MLRKIISVMLLISLMFSLGTIAFAEDIAEPAEEPTATPSKAPVAASVRITFSAGGGKPLPAAQTLSVGENVAEPAEDPVREGYRFTGWYTDSKKTVPYNFGTPVVNRVTLYAGWVKLPTLTFVTSGGKPTPKRAYIIPGQTTVDLPEVTRTGYEFTNWYTDSRKTQVYTSGVGADSGLKLYAGWKKLPAVTFNVKGGKPLPAKQSLGFGDRVLKPEDPVKKGAIFKGWYVDSKCTVQYDFSDKVDGNLKLYARFDVLPVVSFSVSTATPKPASVSINPGDTVEPPRGLTRLNYTFAGWYTSARFTEEFDFAKPIETKTVIYARWERNPVVSFNTKGKTAPPPKVTVPFGETVEPPVTGIPEGYTLEGWYTESTMKNKFDFSSKVTEKLTLYANWVKA
ncbi:hypothetical protein FACS1894208_04510 [Clostridia bacterium]|nr:hypothetical protein FACS1894208_04510 [Clostridia bacterium]